MMKSSDTLCWGNKTSLLALGFIQRSACWLHFASQLHLLALQTHPELWLNSYVMSNINVIKVKTGVPGGNTYQGIYKLFSFYFPSFSWKVFFFLHLTGYLYTCTLFLKFERHRHLCFPPHWAFTHGCPALHSKKSAAINTTEANDRGSPSDIIFKEVPSYRLQGSLFLSYR